MRVRSTRLRTRRTWIIVRWASFNGRWIASADSPDGPTLGLGSTPTEALASALEPFGGASTDGFDVMPDDPSWDMPG
jgi:hypothetical protein